MEQDRKRLVHEIFEGIVFLRRKISSFQRFSPGVGNLPPAQGIVLRIVARQDNLSIKEIAEIMRVSGSAITQLVDSLVKAGFLMREVNPRDRRTLRISLTDDGRSKLEEFKKFHRENLGQVLSPLSDQDLETFRNLLWKILNNDPKFNK